MLLNHLHFHKKIKVMSRPMSFKFEGRFFIRQIITYFVIHYFGLKYDIYMYTCNYTLLETF
jgi:hypothetical protein